jgi:hypothetical protein
LEQERSLAYFAGLAMIRSSAMRRLIGFIDPELYERWKRNHIRSTF